MNEIDVAGLARQVNGTIKGHFRGAIRLNGTCAIDKYVPNRISFAKNKKYGAFLARLRNAVVLIPKSLEDLGAQYPQNTYIVVEDVLKAMMDIQDLFYKDQLIIDKEGVSATAKIDTSAQIDDRVYIGENTFIGSHVVIGTGTKIMPNCCIFENVVIGRGTYIYPDVCVYRNSQIGDDCIIHSGVRIGVDGFRFEQDLTNKLARKWLHVGKAIIGNRVEIGANCTIDRATFEDGSTALSDDVKLDDQVHIGHNVVIGARTLIAAQTCVSGSVKVGKDVWIGAGVTISNGVTVEDKAKVLLNAVVAYDVPEGDVVSGFYAMKHSRWKQVWEKLKERI